MKRKFKLISSIASVSLAVALLVFGVFAAANRNVSITGSVTFKAENVAATVKVFEGIVSETPLGTASFSLTEENGQDDKTIILAPSTQLNDSTKTYVIVYQITNDFADKEAVKVKPTLSGAVSAENEWYVASISDHSAIEVGTTAQTITVTYTIDQSKAPASGTIDLAATLVLVRA